MTRSRSAQEGQRSRRRTRVGAPDGVGRTHRGLVRSICAFALVVALFLGASAFGSSGASAVSRAARPAASGPLPPRTLARVRQAIRQFKDANRTPGVLVGIWSPKGTLVSASGVADLKTGSRLSTDMQYKIASQTKSFTNNLILQLVGEGKVRLGDHISKWVRGVPNGNRITIRQLLTMTSGLNVGFLNVEANIKKLAT